MELKPDVAAVDLLQAFLFLNKASILVCLKSELPSYLAKAADMDAGTDPLVGWKAQRVDFPHLSNAAPGILVVQSLSTAAECAFSLLKALFRPLQDATLNVHIVCHETR